MNVLSDVALAPYNTLGLAARAAALATVATDDELLAALAWAAQRERAVIPLGEGSNIVLAGNLDALVVRMASRGIEILDQADQHVILRVAAGESWHSLVEWTVRSKYYGLENLALIPGTVGAAPIQNIGAYGVELESSLLRVHARRIEDGEIVVLERGECAFGYRDSIFKHALQDQLVITAVELQLARAPAINISYPALAQYFHHASGEITPQQVLDAVVEIRRSRLPDPALESNAGSFFKNPEVAAHSARELRGRFPQLPMYAQPGGTTKLSAAWMIEHCGLKGYRLGEVGVHPRHALVLINYGQATGSQLLQLAAEIAAAVEHRFGVKLSIEPRVYG